MRRGLIVVLGVWIGILLVFGLHPARRSVPARVWEPPREAPDAAPRPVSVDRAPLAVDLPAASVSPSFSLPVRLRTGADVDAELDRDFHKPGARPFLEWMMGLYAFLQPCAGPRVRATRPILYWIYVDVDDRGGATLGFEEDRHQPWMTRPSWTAEEAARVGPLWTGTAWTDEELDAVAECIGTYVAEHGQFHQPHPSWWGQHYDLGMHTRFPVWQADVYRFAAAD